VVVLQVDIDSILAGLESKQGFDPGSHSKSKIARSRTGELCPAHSPGQAPDLICQCYAAHLESGRQRYFKRIAFNVARYGASDAKLSAAVITAWRKNDRWPTACLLAARLRIEVKPDDVAVVRAIGLAS
jgi:hypothetical protein